MALGAAEARADVPLQYIEIVSAKKDCTEKNCYLEYILLSNGLAVRKASATSKYESAATMSTAKMDDDATGAFFGRAAAYMYNHATPAGSSADPDTLFLFDGAKLKEYSAPTSPPEFYALFRDVDVAYSTAQAAPGFFLHGYYAPVKGDTKDVHIFSDGSVITSSFTHDTYVLGSTVASTAGEEELAVLKKLAAAAGGAPFTAYKVCDKAAAITYGFVEFEADGKYVKSYTCGTGDGGIAALFRQVMATGP